MKITKMLLKLFIYLFLFQTVLDFKSKMIFINSFPKSSQLKVSICVNLVGRK